MADIPTAAYACAERAAGHAQCDRWCGLPGKCISNMPAPVPGFCEFSFKSAGDGSTQHVLDRAAFEDMLARQGIRHLVSWDGVVSIDRCDLPKVEQCLERMLRAVAPYIDWTKPAGMPEGHASARNFPGADDLGVALPACTRSHPHENMNSECERLTIIAREQNAAARGVKEDGRG